MKALLSRPTPVEEVTFMPKEGEDLKIFLKREDFFVVPGTQQSGSKARVTWQLLYKAKNKGVKGVKAVALARSSPQSARVAIIAKRVGLPCRIYCPRGSPWPQLTLASQAGAKVLPQFPGYTNVLNK